MLLRLSDFMHQFCGVVSSLLHANATTCMFVGGIQQELEDHTGNDNTITREDISDSRGRLYYFVNFFVTAAFVSLRIVLIL